MKILVVGGGGREHAIIRALKKAPTAAISGVPLATAALVTMPPAKHPCNGCRRHGRLCQGRSL